MTEHEWLTGADPQAMLAVLTDTRSTLRSNALQLHRKLRLFACACCRQVWDGIKCPRNHGEGDGTTTPEWFVLQRHARCSTCHGTGRVGGLTDPRSRRAVEMAEQYADEYATEAELREARNLAHATAPGGTSSSWYLASQPETFHLWDVSPMPPPAAQANLLRCIFGNPWQSLSFGYSMVRTPEGHEVTVTTSSVEQWRSNSTVRAIAQAIYDERRFEEMPILADALEEAGCPEEVTCQECGGKRPKLSVDSFALWNEEVVEIRTSNVSPYGEPKCWVRRANGIEDVVPLHWLKPVPCAACHGTGRIPNPILAHLRQKDRRCGCVSGLEASWDNTLRDCGECHGTGRLPAVHARGCWVLDLIRGK